MPWLNRPIEPEACRFAGGTEDRILRAAEILLLRGVADLTLLGPIKEIEQKASFLGLSLKGAALMDPADPGAGGVCPHLL